MECELVKLKVNWAKGTLTYFLNSITIALIQGCRRAKRNSNEDETKKTARYPTMRIGSSAQLPIKEKNSPIKPVYQENKRSIAIVLYKAINLRIDFIITDFDLK